MRLLTGLVASQISYLCLVGALLHDSPLPLFNLRQKLPVQSDFDASADTQIPLVQPLPHGITQHWFSQNLDHEVANEETFGLRYWKSDRYYRPGGPVIALLGGETSGEDRLEFLDYGIVDILAKATNGLGVVVEHRYYGKSVPRANFTTENLQWLTTSQALADNVHFSRHVDLGYGNSTSSQSAPWVWYGGSYAGAQAAFLAHLYPDDVAGAIASSGVVHAQTNFWEYFEPIRINMDPLCSKSLISAVEYLDATLLLHNPGTTKSIKELFGLAELSDDRDFMNALALPLGFWQQQQWTEQVNHFNAFCDSLTLDLRQDEASAVNLRKVLLNYATYVKKNILPQCPLDTSVTTCFASASQTPPKYDLSQTWRLWLYQVCTEWGYHMPAPPPGTPSLISRLLDLEYVSSLCRSAYTDAPGQVPMWPDTSKVNAYGDFAIGTTNGPVSSETMRSEGGDSNDDTRCDGNYDDGGDGVHQKRQDKRRPERVMIVDGTLDPWLYATPHSPYSNLHRAPTAVRPFTMIRGGVHHSDEYGVRRDARGEARGAGRLREPESVREVHALEIETVKTWLKLYDAEHSRWEGAAA